MTGARNASLKSSMGAQQRERAPGRSRRRLRRWSIGGIRARVVLSMLLVLGTVAPAFALAAYYFGQMQGILLQLSNMEAPLVWAGVRIAASIRLARQSEKNFLLLGSVQSLDRHARALSETEERIEEGLALGEPWSQRFEEVRRRLQEYRVAAEGLASLREAPAQQRAAAFDRLQEAGETLAAEGRALAEEGWQRASQARARSLQYAEYAQRNLLVALAVSALLTLYLVLSLPSRIVQPLRRQLHALQQAAQGDYSVGSLPRSADEVGELSVGIERLLATFREFDSLKTEKIRALGARFRALAEEMQVPIAWIDTDLVIRYCNRAFTQAVGALADGAKVGAALGPETLEPMLRLMVRGRDPGELPPVEPISPAAEARRFLAHTSSIRDSKGQLVGFLITLRPQTQPSNAP